MLKPYWYNRIGSSINQILRLIKILIFNCSEKSRWTLWIQQVTCQTLSSLITCRYPQSALSTNPLQIFPTSAQFLSISLSPVWYGPPRIITTMSHLKLGISLMTMLSHHHVPPLPIPHCPPTWHTYSQEWVATIIKKKYSNTCWCLLLRQSTLKIFLTMSWKPLLVAHALK